MCIVLMKLFDGSATRVFNSKFWDPYVGQTDKK